MFVPRIPGARNGHDPFRVVELPATPLSFYRGYELIRGGLRRVNREFKRESFDVIHCQTPLMAGVIALAISRAHDVPVVAHYHTLLDEYVSHLTYGYFDRLAKNILGPLQALYLKKFFARSGSVITPSNFAKGRLQGLGARNITVVPNCVDLERFLPDGQNEVNGGTEGRRRIIYVGRMSLEKKVDGLLKAFQLMRDPSLELLLVGDGPQSNYLRSLATSLGLQNVRFAGTVSDSVLPSLYSSSTVFATASDTENLPVTVLEAMASGMPVMAVAAGGTPELVIDGKSGFLAKPNDPEDFAQKLKMMLGDEELLRRFGHSSRNLAENYSVQSVCRRLESVYRKATITWRREAPANRFIRSVLKWI